MSAETASVTAGGGAADWSLDCSDDERFADWTEEYGELLPPLDVVQELYARVERDDVDLSWRCRGRRPPPQTDTATDEQAEPIRLPDMSDFDFGNDDFAQPAVTTPRRQPGAAPRGSAKKKSTSFDKILKNMKRTRELEAREAAAAAEKVTAKTPESTKSES